jgi:protease-4
MAGDAIVAQPGTITGSIGVFGGKFTLRGLYDKIGMTREILTHGRNAALFSEYRPWNEEERAKVRSLMVSFYETFVTKAAAGRHKTYEELDRIAQGRVWTGADALKIGLVDRLGGLEEALTVAKERAKLDKDQEVALVVLPQRKGFFEALMERQEENIADRVLPPDVRSLLRFLTALNGPVPIARLPFDLKVR